MRLIWSGLLKKFPESIKTEKKSIVVLEEFRPKLSTAVFYYFVGKGGPFCLFFSARVSRVESVRYEM